MFFHFPLSRNSMQKWYLQRDCVTSHEKLKCLSFFSRINFQKVLYPPVILFACFFPRKYHPHLLSFSLIVMAFPACTCELVHIQHSFEFLCMCRAQLCRSGSKDICTLQHGFLRFLLFLYLYFILYLALSHMYVFLFPKRVPSVGYEKSILTRTENLFITICFKEPLLFITLILKRMCFYLSFISIRT